MGEVETIDDLIVLGRAAPEPIDDGRHTVCLGGYSKTHGYIRIYPTQRRMHECRRWNVVSVPVEKSEEDTREESYKIEGSKQDWDELHKKIEKVGRLDKHERIRLIHNLASDCRASLNEEQRSLGMVEVADIKDAYLEPTDGNTTQLDLSWNKLKGKNEYENKLYINYRCQGCEQKTPHDQHTIEWGVYRNWDKHENKEMVKDALKLNEDGYKHYFFIGNLNNRRTAYVIISVIYFKETEMVDAGLSVGNQSDLGAFS
jgi:hypothetical protein